MIFNCFSSLFVQYSSNLVRLCSRLIKMEYHSTTLQSNHSQRLSFLPCYPLSINDQLPRYESLLLSNIPSKSIDH